MPLAPTLAQPVSRPSASRRKRLLLVAYMFPPVGGAGVQRPVKWVKYLQEFGWDVTVLTPSNPSVPLIDESLLADIPPSATIIRAPTWEPSYKFKQQVAIAKKASHSSLSRLLSLPKELAKRVILKLLQPDPQVLWYPNAVRAGADQLASMPHDAILATAPPYSGFLVGERLARKFKLPLVLDYRDEWDLSSKYLENFSKDWWSDWIQDQMQQRLLKAASAVVATTRASVQSIESRLSRAKCETLTRCIYNGFDPDDLTGSASTNSNRGPLARKPGTIRLVYTGTLWNLTSLSPFADALERLRQANEQRLSQIEFVCIGRKTPEQQLVLDRCSQTGCQVVNLDYCPHSEVLDWQRSADALLLLLSDVPGAERVVPAKLFEYLAIQKEVLAISPQGEALDLLRPHWSDSCFVPKDIPGIANWLTRQLNSIGETTPSPAAQSRIDQYSRRSQAGELARLLDQLTTSR